MKRLVGVALATVVALGLSGCVGNGTGGGEQSGAAQQSAGAGYPVTIKSALGKTTIEKKPQRVVTIGWGSQDAALALGVVPVGMQDFSDNTSDKDGVLPWDKGRLKGRSPELIKATTKELPTEDIANLKPDLILAVNSGLNVEQFKKLQGVAPTVAYPGKPWLTSWQDQLRIAGKALGESDRAARLEKQTNGKIAKAKKEHPEFEGKTAAFGGVTDGANFNLYLQRDSRVQLLHDLGFTISKSVPTSGKSFAKPMSMEKVGGIDSDILVSWYLTPDLKKKVESSSTFKRVRAVKRGGYFALNDPAMLFAANAPSVLGLPWMLDRYTPMLSKAAKGS